jgi:TetR/AcrR family transcriptional repressor of nem operon
MKKGEATRREIIEKAAPIFNRKGFEGASLSDLMAATGLEKGGIYRHFESKEQLAGEAFDYAWNAAITLRLAGTEEIENSVDRLKQIVRNFRDRREGLVPGGCPLLNTATDSDDGNPMLRAKVKRALRLWLNRIVAVVAKGQERGEIKASVEAEELANLIVSTLEGSLMLRRLQRKDEPVALACRHLEGYLEEKVRA